ncbi:hypothetical protein [Pelagicoccus albus]|uniref:Uncharacterized protein n=1 Tax=Pelagicoccus albus TaxID=415222 RepID=A0A7X1B8E0_9BACT|nr:hypothetical protein [Pelagicoccus albus]MBC2607269.1 hypothetical protein [Pelagicoccus albus]
MNPTAFPEANRLTYRIRAALTGESTGQETAKLAWQMAEAVDRANTGLNRALEALTTGSLLDCLIIDAEFPKLLETANALNHPYAEDWQKSCELHHWRIAAPLDTGSASKIQKAIEEQGDLKAWLLKQYRSTARSKTQKFRAYQIIGLIAQRFPEDENAQEELAARRQQLIEQANAEVQDSLSQLIPAKAPKEIVKEYLLLGLPLKKSKDPAVKKAAKELRAEQVKELSEQTLSAVKLAAEADESSDWQKAEESYLKCEYSLSIYEARGAIPTEDRSALDTVGTQLARIRNQFETQIAIRTAIYQVHNGLEADSKPVKLANRVEKLKSLESQAMKTGVRLPQDLQEEMKVAYAFANRRRLPFYGSLAAILIICGVATYLFIEQNKQRKIEAALQAEALAALQKSEENATVDQTRQALEEWQGEIDKAEQESSLLEKASVLETWLADQTEMETQYQESVAEFSRLIAEGDPFANEGIVTSKASEIQSMRDSLASDLGTESDQQFETALTLFQERKDQVVDGLKKDLSKVERELRIATNNATQATNRAEFERLQAAAEKRAQLLEAKLQDRRIADQRSVLSPFLKSVNQQLSDIETKWEALDNAWIQLAKLKELKPYLAQMERIHSFDILAADKKTALSQTLRLKEAFANLDSAKAVFPNTEAEEAFKNDTPYLTTQPELSDIEKTYLERLQNLDKFKNVYQSQVQYFEGTTESHNEYRIYLHEPVSKSDSEETDSNVTFSFKVRGFNEMGRAEPEAREVQFISREDGSFWGFFYKPSTLSPESQYYNGSISNTLSILLAGADRTTVVKQLEDLEKQEELSPAFRIYWQQELLGFMELQPWKWGLALSPTLQKRNSQLKVLTKGHKDPNLWLSTIEQTVPSPEFKTFLSESLGTTPLKEIRALADLYEKTSQGGYELAGFALEDGEMDLFRRSDRKTSLWSVNSLTGTIDRIGSDMQLTAYAPILRFSFADGSDPSEILKKASSASGLKLGQAPFSNLLPEVYQ